MKSRLRYWIPVAGYTTLIFYLSAQSHPEQELPSFIMLFSDKLLHGIEYAVLGGLCYRAFRWGTNDIVARHAMLLAIFASSFYGMTDEVHQWFVPFRESTWQDWIADTTGAAIGTAAFHWIEELLITGGLSVRRPS